jgi:hypothetical protein
LEVNNYGVRNFYFFGIWKQTSERVRIPHTCLILDLITGQAVQSKSGLFFMDPFAPEIQEVSVLSGLVRVRRGGLRMQYTVVRTPSPITSPTPPPAPEVLVEVEENPFLPSPLLRPSVHEDAVVHNVVSRTPSPPVVPKKKGKKGKKKFKY